MGQQDLVIWGSIIGGTILSLILLMGLHSQDRKRPALMICESCHDIGHPRLRGVSALELILWVIGLLPGFLYSLWRRSGGGMCPSCQGHMIPLDSPRGLELQEK